MKKFKPSFTLLEILVAVAIFAVVVLVSLATVSSVMKPKAKTHTMQSLQESAWRAMETMVEQIKRANENYPDRYQRFALTDEEGNPISTPSPQYPGSYESHRLNAIYRVPQAGNETACLGGPCYNTIVRAFGVYQGGNLKEGECVPTYENDDGRCKLKMVIRIERGDPPYTRTTTYEDISTPDIDVLSITFQGYHWTTSEGDIFPWVEIEMKARSRSQNQPVEGATITIKTKISPSYNMKRRNVY
jgi:type II secretory pathway component PulJ